MKTSATPACGSLCSSAAGFCMALAHGALYAFFTLHLQREGYSGTMIGFLWTLGVIAEIIVFMVTRPRRVALNEVLVRPTEQAD